MPNVLYKALYIMGAVCIAALVVIWGIRQYGNSRVAAQELGTVKEAVQEAVAARAQYAELKSKERAGAKLSKDERQQVEQLMLFAQTDEEL